MQKHLLIAVPAHTPQVYWQTSHSIHTACKALSEMGWNSSVVYLTGLADLCRARNILAAAFHADDKFTDMLCIDSDVSWDRGTVERLVSHPVDLVFGAYPLKSDGGGYPVSGFEDQRTSVRFVNPETDEEVGGGIVEVAGGPGGFMRISKKCMSAMVRAYDHLWYGDDLCPDEKAWSLFEFSIHDHKRMGEDLEFCRKFREIGGKVWLDPWLTLHHHGYKAWTGCIQKSWAELAERAALEGFFGHKNGAESHPLP